MNVAPTVFITRLTVDKSILHDLRFLINRIRGELVYVELVLEEKDPATGQDFHLDLEFFIADFLKPEIIEKIRDISEQNRPMYIFVHEECREYERVREEICSSCTEKKMRVPNFQVYRGYGDIYYVFKQWVRTFLPPN